MSPRSSLVQIFTSKLHTKHPLISLTPLAIAAWMEAPTFAMGDTNTEDLPAPIQMAADTVRSALLGAKAPAADATAIFGSGEPK